jgi:hypothetical protein
MGDARRGRARPERPWAAVVSLRGQRHERRPQRLGLLGHRRDLPCAGRRCVGLQPLLDVRAARLEQTRDETRQRVCRGRDGLGGPESRVHPSTESPQGTLRVVHTAGGEAQGDGDTMGPGAPPPRQHFPTRDLVVGTPAQPATNVLPAWPPVPVRADRTEENESGVCFDPLDGRQVDARHARERGAGLAPRCVGLWVSAGFGGQGLPSAWVGTSLQRPCALLIALGPLLVGDFVQRDGLASGTQVFGTPGAL